ncbi:MAG: hypothetical protein N2746_11720 [Deltaproteobacteria bacterium]|nr:hypothetical protein [Deltaproteobacteria bacterium]
MNMETLKNLRNLVNVDFIKSLNREQIKALVEYYIPRGIKFNLTMSGTHRMISGKDDRGDLPLTLTINCVSNNVLNFVKRDSGEFLRMEITGTITATDLVENAEVRGSVEYDFISKRQFVYEFYFTDKNGREYYFNGHNDISIFQPIKSFSTMLGEIVDRESGKIVSTVVLKIEAKDIFPLIKSFRIVK